MDAPGGQSGWTAPASSHVERVATTVTASSTYAPAQPQPQATPHTPPHRAHTTSVSDRAGISNNAHSSSESEVQSGPSDYALLRLAPAQTTTVVTTTTTTTTHFAPIRVPKSGPIRATRSSFSAPSTGHMANAAPLSPRAAVYDFYDRTEGPSSSSSTQALSLDRRMYPLSQARWPDTLKQWDLSLGAMKATFSEDGAASDFPVRDPRTSSAHARMDTDFEAASLSTQQGRRYSTASIQDPASPARRGAGLDLQGSTYRDNADPLGGHADGDGVPRVTFETYGHRLPSPGPPRKRPRVETPPLAGSLANLHPSGPAARRASMQQNYTGGSVALPSPNQSPPSPVPTSGGEDEQEMKDDPAALLSTAHAQQFDFGSGAALSGLLSLPDLVQTFSQLPDAMQSYLLFQLLRRSSIPVLQMINQIVEPALRRDFLSDLPPELGTIILGHLDARDLCRSSLVCKTWRRMIDGEWRVWKDKLVASGLWVSDGSDEREAREAATGKKEDLFLKRWEAGVWDEQVGPWFKNFVRKKAEVILTPPPASPLTAPHILDGQGRTGQPVPLRPDRAARGICLPPSRFAVLVSERLSCPLDPFCAPVQAPVSLSRHHPSELGTRHADSPRLPVQSVVRLAATAASAGRWESTGAGQQPRRHLSPVRQPEDRVRLRRPFDQRLRHADGSPSR